MGGGGEGREGGGEEVGYEGRGSKGEKKEGGGRGGKGVSGERRWGRGGENWGG